jgi:hypothetical protein
MPTFIWPDTTVDCTDVCSRVQPQFHERRAKGASLHIQLSFVDLLVSYAAISGTAKNASTPPIAIDSALIPVA